MEGDDMGRQSHPLDVAAFVLLVAVFGAGITAGVLIGMAM